MTPHRDEPIGPASPGPTAPRATDHPPRAGWTGVRIEARDNQQVWTVTAIVAVVAAVGLAVAGVPQADLHGPLHYLGIMDPACGGTRSWYLALHGHLAAAMRYNPAGPLLLLGAVAALLRAVAGWSSGRWVSIRVPRRVVVPVLVAGLVVLEVRQQLHADLLTQPWHG